MGFSCLRLGREAEEPGRVERESSADRRNGCGRRSGTQVGGRKSAVFGAEAHFQ